MSDKSITLLELHLHDGFDFTANAENTAPAIGRLGGLFGSDDADEDASADSGESAEDAADDASAESGENADAEGDTGESAPDASSEDDDSVVSSGPALAAALLLLALVAAAAIACSGRGDDIIEGTEFDDGG
ncbi:MAG: hypothetical protein ABEI27_14485 [Halobellus sp.]|uniref:hypothetical protein n=1 Tax=Halobellus sp. TaxID=1979212 RepID=UPI0035D424BC